MVKTKHYNNWIKRNLPLVINGLDKAERFPIEIEIKVVGGFGFTDKNDIDNINKACVDILVKANIIPDDNVKYIIRCEERFFPFPGGGSEAITVLSYFEPD